MNKLSILAVIVIAIFGTQSCSKTQFQPANLVGTWTMTEMLEEGTSKTVYVDNVITEGDQITRTSEYSRKFVGDANFTGTELFNRIYDGLGVGNYSFRDELYTYTGTKLFSQETGGYVGGATFENGDTSNYSRKKYYTITFNKDKTYTLVTTIKSTSSNTQTYSSHSYTFTNSEESVTTTKGSWAFIGADKNQDYKNKERIGLWKTSSVSNSSYAYAYVYTDLDPLDGYDYSQDTYSSSSVSDYTDEESKDTYPSMVWEMIEGSKEMKVSFMYNGKGNGKETNTYIDNTGTDVSIQEYTREDEGITTISLSK